MSLLGGAAGFTTIGLKGAAHLLNFDRGAQDSVAMNARKGLPSALTLTGKEVLS